MHKEFKESEYLYRAILPRFLYDKRNGEISSAAFKDSKGLSVDRANDRDEDEICRLMRNHNLRGDIYKVTVGNCKTVDAVVKPRPTDNPFHCEIHSSEVVITLSSEQCKYLASMAIRVEKG